MVAGVDLVVASRFHNLLCALKVGVPTLSISYARKNDVLQASMGLGDFCHPAAEIDFDRLVAQFRELDRRTRAGRRAGRGQPAEPPRRGAAAGRLGGLPARLIRAQAQMSRCSVEDHPRPVGVDLDRELLHARAWPRAPRPGARPGSRRARTRRRRRRPPWRRWPPRPAPASTAVVELRSWRRRWRAPAWPPSSCPGPRRRRPASPRRSPSAASPARSRSWSSCVSRSPMLAVCSLRIVSALRVIPV